MEIVALVGVCVCVRERERKREEGGDRKEREQVNVRRERVWHMDSVSLFGVYTR